MRLVVDEKKCLGNSLCEGTSPELFRVSDDGIAEVLQPELDAAQEAAARRAEALCPTQAISIVAT